MSIAGNLFMSTFVGGASLALAYRYTHLPITQQDSSGSRFRVCGNDLVENVAIREAFSSFLKKTGIREDLFFGEQIVTQADSLQNMGFYGANCSRGGPAGINLWKHLFLWDPNACQGVIKHELGHIKHNDAVRGPLMDSVANTALLFFGSLIPLPACASLIAGGALTLTAVAAIGLSMGIAKIISTRYRESQADTFAIHESSIDELKGFRRFLMVIQKTNEIGWKSLGVFSKIWHYDWAHPSVASRIDRINQELQKRRALIDDAEERVKEERLLHFLYLMYTLQPTDTVREPPASHLP